MGAGEKNEREGYQLRRTATFIIQPMVKYRKKKLFLKMGLNAGTVRTAG